MYRPNILHSLILSFLTLSTGQRCSKFVSTKFESCPSKGWHSNTKLIGLVMVYHPSSLVCLVSSKPIQGGGPSLICESTCPCKFIKKLFSHILEMSLICSKYFKTSFCMIQEFLKTFFQGTRTIWWMCNKSQWDIL